MSKKQRITIGMDRDENIAKILRGIADALEGADPGEQLDGLPEDFCGLRIRVRGRGERRSLEVRVKSSRRAGRVAKKESKREYKALKKRIGKSFAAIVKSARSGKIPVEKDLHQFLADSAAMTAIPGYGDKMYPDYKSACAKFAEACAKSDPSAVKDAVRTLADLKKSCHAKYK